MGHSQAARSGLRGFLGDTQPPLCTSVPSLSPQIPSARPPQKVVKHKGSEPTSAWHRVICVTQVPPRSGPWPSRHLPNTAPLDGAMLRAASAKGRGPPFPQASGTGQEGPKNNVKVPSGPETQCQAAPGWAVHVEAINSTVQKPNKHKPNKIPDIKTQRGA